MTFSAYDGVMVPRQRTVVPVAIIVVVVHHHNHHLIIIFVCFFNCQMRLFAKI